MIFFQFFFVTMFEIVRFPMNLKILVGQEKFYFKDFFRMVDGKMLNECEDNSVSTTIGDVLVKK